MIVWVQRIQGAKCEGTAASCRKDSRKSPLAADCSRRREEADLFEMQLQSASSRRQLQAYLTELTSGDKPWIRTSSRSPDSIGPTPLGVPVRMISPGSKVMLVEMKLTRR